MVGVILVCCRVIAAIRGNLLILGVVVKIVRPLISIGIRHGGGVINVPVKVLASIIMGTIV